MPVKKETAEEAKQPKVDPAFAKKHNLPDEYVEAVNNGLLPEPPRGGPLDNDEGELHYQPGGWTKTAKGEKPKAADPVVQCGHND